MAGLVDKYQTVEFFGPLDRLAIVFYPAGINHFMRKPLGSFLEKHYSFFNYFDVEFEAFLPKIYDEPILETKRDLLDEFFLKEFKSFNEPKLLQAVELLINDKETINVGQLAENMGINRRTLLRKFKKYLGYSIEDYIKVIKFRKALSHYQLEGNTNLANIAYESNYYDQADFNHNLKSISGLTPLELFSELQIMDDVLFWKL